MSRIDFSLNRSPMRTILWYFGRKLYCGVWNLLAFSLSNCHSYQVCNNGKEICFSYFLVSVVVSRLLSRCGWAALASSVTTHNNSYCDYSSEKAMIWRKPRDENRRPQAHTEDPASIFYLIFIIQFNLDHTFSSIRKVTLIHVVCLDT